MSNAVEVKPRIVGTVVQLTMVTEGRELPVGPASDDFQAYLTGQLTHLNMCNRTSCQAFEACQGVGTVTISGAVQNAEREFVPKLCALEGKPMLIPEMVIQPL